MIEVVIAIAVMAIGLASAAITLQLGLRNLDVARTTTLVSEILQDQAEEIRLRNWASVSLLPANGELPLPQEFESTLAEEKNLRITCTTTDLPDYEGLKHITLTATWTDLGGRLHSRTVHLRYARNGVYDYYYGTL